MIHKLFAILHFSLIYFVIIFILVFATSRCHCGRPIASHPDDVADGDGEISVDGEWTSQNNTKRVPSIEKRVFFPLNEVTGSQAKSARVRFYQKP